MGVHGPTDGSSARRVVSSVVKAVTPRVPLSASVRPARQDRRKARSPRPFRSNSSMHPCARRSRTAPPPARAGPSRVVTQSAR